MNNGRYWRIEVETQTRDVLEVFPKIDDFFRRVVTRESVSRSVWRQDDDPKLTILTLAVLSPSRDLLFGYRK
jgi:hypothetical protein